MSDAWLIIGIFVFAFILWAATGGPNRPISFAGPYLTPISTIGDAEGDYSEEGTDTRGGGTSWWGSANNDRDKELAIWGTVSPFKDQVRIGSGSGGPGATDLAREYVTMRATSDAESVNVTGWQIMSMKTGASVTIPQAQIIAQQAGSSNIILNSGQEVIVSTGRSLVGASFRDNACTGYLAQGRTFTPSLRTSCPAPLDELGDFFEGDASSYNECRETVRSFQRCTAPSIPRGTSSRCRNFIEDRLSYAGCVRVHKNDAEFYADTWRVYVDRSKELWRTDNETLRLVDREGRTVDVYTY